MKPTKLLILDKSAKWWSNKKLNANFAFFHKNDWWVVKSCKPTEKPTEKPAAFFKKTSVSGVKQGGGSLLLYFLAAALGISLALNLLNFLWL